MTLAADGVRRARARPARRSRLRRRTPVTSAPPEPSVLATVGNLRVQSPVAEGGVTAVGFHGSRRGRARPPARRPAGERGASRAALAPDHGLDAPRPAPGTSSRAARSGRSTSAQSPGPTSTRRSTEPSSRSATTSSRDDASAPRSSCAPRRRRRSSSRSRTSTRSRAERRRERRRRLLEARHRGRRDISRFERAGSRAIRRPTAATTSRSGLPVGHARRAVGSRRSLRILFIADVVGTPGRGALEAPPAEAPRGARGRRLRRERRERSRRRSGSRRASPISILGMGVDAITLGNHAFRRTEIGPYLDGSDRVVRPANTSREHARTRPRRRPSGERRSARRDQRPRLALPPPGDVDVRGDRRPRRGSAARDAASSSSTCTPRRRARRPRSRAGSTAGSRPSSARTRTSRPRTHACSPEGTAFITDCRDDRPARLRHRRARSSWRSGACARDCPCASRLLRAACGSRAP